jgi:oxygen-dependent protoporphyrinogen oxidase
VNGRRVVVVGAGLSGLACAFDLVRAGLPVTVLDAGARAGGVVGTVERDGFLFETGPTTVQASAAGFRALCADVGLLDRLIVSQPAADERYLFHRGKLHVLPASPTSLMSSSILSFSARLRLASEITRPFAPSRTSDDPDLETFFTERIGPEPTRLFAGAFVRGIFAAELRELGVRSAFPSIWSAAVEHGGLIRAARASKDTPRPPLPGLDVPRTSLLSFPNGLRELVDALARSLGSSLVTQSRVTRIERNAGSWRVSTESGAVHEAPLVVIATSAPIAAELLTPLPGARACVDGLRQIEHARLTLVHLGLDSSEIPGFPPGFGFLVPPPERAGDPADPAAPRVLGTLFTSNLFAGRAPPRAIAVSSFFNTTDVEGLSDSDLAEEACVDLARAFRLRTPPRARVSFAQRWNDVIPRYSPGHADRVRDLLADMETHVSGIHLAGCYTAGISVDQVILRGRAVARALAEKELS